MSSFFILSACFAVCLAWLITGEAGLKSLAIIYGTYVSYQLSCRLIGPRGPSTFNREDMSKLWSILDDVIDYLKALIAHRLGFTHVRTTPINTNT